MDFSARAGLAVLLSLLLTACQGPSPMVMKPGDDLTDKPVAPLEKKPDLIIDDMYFTAKKIGQDKFPQYTLHVRVKNVGTAPTSNRYTVKLWKEQTEARGMVFEPVLPIAQGTVVLQPSEHHTYDWNFGVGLVGQSDYYPAVVDIPVGGEHPLGFDEEGPTIAAEKNNARGIPAPRP